ncbi:MAG: DUF393 domain-containing protein [Deltaproteobacteria bacterium]|nr:DUF393 domain-containing protein [Deltaproteobacteria bacterium]
MAKEMPEVVRKNPNLIVVDGLCHLCCAWMSFVLKRDSERRFKFTFFQAESGAEILQWLAAPHLADETLIYIQKGRPYYRSAAFLKIIISLGKGWYLLAIGFLLPQGIRDWLYDRFAERRYGLFGKRQTCPAPDGDFKNRLV